MTIGKEYEFVWEGDQAKTVAPRPHLPPGKYTFKATAKFDAEPEGKDAPPAWKGGEITTPPVTITVTKKP